MKNAVFRGDAIDIAAPYAVSAGEYAYVGALGGVAFGDAESAAPVTIATVGVFDLAKDANNVFAVGQPVFFSSGDKLCHSNLDEDSNSEGAVQIGVAVAAAGAGASTVRVRLTQPVTAA